MPIIETRDLSFSYKNSDKLVLDHIDTAFEKEKLYVIFGPSGCGKTTLLALLGALDVPTGGQVLFDGRDCVRDRPGAPPPPECRVRVPEL